MVYSEGIRKIHGRVRIIYTDSERSMEVSSITSGNGAYSSPHQVYEGHLVPTVKACTMDGSSTMGGGFQMIGRGLVTGWWSDIHSGENGEFAPTYPYIEIRFIARPVLKWTVIGDEKLGQYPVDFNIIAYDADGSVKGRREVRGNESVRVTVDMESPLIDVTSIKLEILRWSRQNTKIKILHCFDVLEETYTGMDLKQFEVLEEAAPETGGVSYGINSDTASFTIYNRERKFDQGYLRSLLLLDRKVIPSIGIEDSSGNINYTELGVFYSDEWEIPQKEQWVKLKCVDRLLKLQKKIYIGFPYSANVTLKEIAADVLLSSGFTTDEFQIDDALDQITTEKGFLGKQSVWDALQDICNAGLCRVYIDRHNKIRISMEKENGSYGSEIAPDRIFAYDKHTRQTDFCNYIAVNYSNITESDNVETVYQNIISIDAGGKVKMIVDYSATVSGAYINYLPVNGIALNYFKSSINAGSFELENLTDSIKIVEVTISGLIVKVNTQTIVIQDEESVEKYGIMDYTHAASDLVQSYRRAAEIGEILLSKLSQGVGVLKITWRGDPDLELGNTFECEDRFGNKSKYLCEYNRYSFDGGLKQDTRAREVTDGDME